MGVVSSSFAKSKEFFRHHSSSKTNPPSSSRSTSTDLTISTDYHALSSPVPYSTPFFLQDPTTEKNRFFWPSVLSLKKSKPDAKYWAVDEESLACSVRNVMQTSLLTFHGPNATAYNLNRSSCSSVIITPGELVNTTGSEALMQQQPPQSATITVLDGARVLIYCNVKDGRYLTNNENLEFSADPSQVRADESINRACEFIVTKISRNKNIDGQLRFGEEVIFECGWQSGLFLCVDQKDSALVLGKKSKSFVLSTPTLQQLIQLRDIAAATSTVKTNNRERTDSSDPFAYGSEQDRLLAKAVSERDRLLFARLPLLPSELTFKILSFQHDFVKTARLVCKQWQQVAEGRIRTIRVNGEFSSLESLPERMNLVNFVMRCTNLTSLILRNVVDLEDSEVAQLFEGSNLVRVALGGCSRLSDRTTAAVAKSTKLKHVNLASTAITDQSLCILAESARHLRFLNLYACKGVTPAGFARCANGEGLVELESINLRGTRVNHRDTVEFTRRRPSTQVLTGPAVAESIYG